VSGPEAGIILCAVGAERFAVDLAALEGIERTDLLQLSPADDGVSGWLLGAREDVPVWSLARLLGRSDNGAAREERAVLMVPAARGGGRVGWLVVRVERLAAPPREIHPLPSPFGSAHAVGVCAVVRTADGLALQLDPEALRSDRPAPAADAADVAVGGAVAAEPPMAEDGVLCSPIGAAAPGTGRALIAELLARSADGRPVAVALAAGQVREIVGAQAIVPVPGAPDHLPGLLLWRDRALPVLDLVRRVAGPGRLSVVALPASRFVVVSAGAEEVALPVGRDVRFERLPLPAHPLPRVPELDGAGLLGSYDLAGSLLLVFDIARSLAGKERESHTFRPAGLS
jgi:chemotaxis signal transduction protein